MELAIEIGADCVIRTDKYSEIPPGLYRATLTPWETEPTHREHDDKCPQCRQRLHDLIGYEGQILRLEAENARLKKKLKRRPCDWQESFPSEHGGYYRRNCLRKLGHKGDHRFVD